MANLVFASPRRGLSDSASAERPPAQARRIRDRKSVEIREDEVVRHLVPLKRRPVKLNEGQGLRDLL